MMSPALSLAVFVRIVLSPPVAADATAERPSESANPPGSGQKDGPPAVAPAGRASAPASPAPASAEARSFGPSTIASQPVSGPPHPAPGAPGPGSSPSSRSLSGPAVVPPSQSFRPPARRPSHTTLAEALSLLPKRPSVRQAQTAALRVASLDARASARWLRRARRSAALPTLSVSYDLRNDQGWQFDEEPGTADTLGTDAGASNVMRLRATWELDRLWFNVDELRAARAQLDHHEWRQRLLLEITRLYFERQRIALEQRLRPDDALEVQTDRALRRQEIEAILVGLTHLRWDD